MLNKCKFCQEYYNYKYHGKIEKYGYCSKKCLELYDYRLFYKPGHRQVVFEKNVKEEKEGGDEKGNTTI